MNTTRSNQNRLFPLIALIVSLGCSQQRPGLDDDIRTRDDPRTGIHRFDDSGPPPTHTKNKSDAGLPDTPHPEPDEPSHRVIQVTDSGVHNPGRDPRQIGGRRGHGEPVPDARTRTTERCNGLDDDLDGVIDEGFQLTASEDILELDVTPAIRHQARVSLVSVNEKEHVAIWNRSEGSSRPRPYTVRIDQYGEPIDDIVRVGAGHRFAHWHKGPDSEILAVGCGENPNFGLRTGVFDGKTNAVKTPWAKVENQPVCSAGVGAWAGEAHLVGFRLHVEFDGKLMPSVGYHRMGIFSIDAGRRRVLGGRSGSRRRAGGSRGSLERLGEDHYRRPGRC